MADEDRKARKETGGLIVAGCLFMGMGIGWFWGEFKVGLFVGLGIGLLGMALYTSKGRR